MRKVIVTRTICKDSSIMYVFSKDLGDGRLENIGGALAYKDGSLQFEGVLAGEEIAFSSNDSLARQIEEQMPGFEVVFEEYLMA